MKTHMLVSPFRQRRTRLPAAALLAGALALGLQANDSTGSAERSAAGTHTGSDAARQSDSGSLKRGEKKFIKKVAESSPKELAIARLAVQRASDPQVKEYARQIISDHREMNQDLVSIAREKDVEIDNLHVLTTAGTSYDAARAATAAARREAAGSAAAGSTAGAARGTGTAGTDAIAARENRGGLADTMDASGSGDDAMTTALPAEITSDRDYRRLAEKSGQEFDRAFVEMMRKDHQKDLKMFRDQAENASDPAVQQFASRHADVLQGHLDRAETLSQSVAE